MSLFSVRAQLVTYFYFLFLFTNYIYKSMTGLLFNTLSKLKLRNSIHLIQKFKFHYYWCSKNAFSTQFFFLSSTSAQHHLSRLFLSQLYLLLSLFFHHFISSYSIVNFASVFVVLKIRSFQHLFTQLRNRKEKKRKENSLFIWFFPMQSINPISVN